MAALHSERLLDHFRNPRHPGVLPPPAVVVEALNPACGDWLKLSARVDAGCIVEAAFQVRGCTASIAAGSALAEWMTGRPLAEVRALDAALLENLLGGLSASTRHAAVLATAAARDLLARLSSAS